MHLQKVRMPQSVYSSPNIKEKVSRREAFQLSLVGNNSPVRKLAMGDDKNTPPPSPDVRKTLVMSENTPPPSPDVRKTLVMSENTPPPSPDVRNTLDMGMGSRENASPTKGLLVISTKSGSFSPVTVEKMDDGKNHVAKKRVRVMGPNGKIKDMRGFQTNCPEHTIILWKDWLRNRCAHGHSGPASKHFVKTTSVTTIQDGGDDGLWIFEITMEYVMPVLDFLSSDPDQSNKLAKMYYSTLMEINKLLVDDGVVLEDPHPGNCGLRFHPDGTYELVFFDLQFSPIDKGIVIPGGYMLGDNMPNEMSKHDRKVIMRQRALLLMVESIRHYDPSSEDKTIHLQEIACKCGIDQMNLEQVNHALDAFAL